MTAISVRAAIPGIGASRSGRHLPESQPALGAAASRSALEDAGLDRSEVDDRAAPPAASRSGRTPQPESAASG